MNAFFDLFNRSIAAGSQCLARQAGADILHQHRVYNEPVDHAPEWCAPFAELIIKMSLLHQRRVGPGEPE